MNLIPPRSQAVAPGYVIGPAGNVIPGPALQKKLDNQRKQMQVKTLLNESLLRQAHLAKTISEQEAELSAHKQELTKVSKLIDSLQSYNDD